MYKDVYHSIVSNSGIIEDRLNVLVRDWNKSCYSHTVEYHTAIKMMLSMYVYWHGKMFIINVSEKADSWRVYRAFQFCKLKKNVQASE